MNKNDTIIKNIKKKSPVLNNQELLNYLGIQTLNEDGSFITTEQLLINLTEYWDFIGRGGFQ